MKATILTFCALTLLSASCCHQKKEPVDYVNPRMGNISILLQPARPTIQLPNSILRVYPNRADQAADRLEGLPVITVKHREQTAFRICPFSAEISANPRYSYDREVITPYSYDVVLDEEGIDVSYALSHQGAIYDFSFENAFQPAVALDAFGGELSIDGSSVKGWQYVPGYKVKVYIYAEASEEPSDARIDRLPGGNATRAILSFQQGTGRVAFRYAVSYIDEDQARANLYREIEGFDTQALAAEGRREWNEKLGKIKVKGSDEKAKAVFYTSLYRTYERMICMDEGGRYFSPYDNQVHSTGANKFYNDDWIWDTHIATHPLRIIIEPEMETDMVQSYVTMAQQMGDLWLPTFPEAVGDTRRMNCNHACVTLADAFIKGLQFDAQTGLEACKRALTEKTLIPWSAAPAGVLDEFYWQNGYFPGLRMDEEETVKEVDVRWERRQPVTVTLGTAYDCWAVSRLAKALGNEADAEYFAAHGYDYRNIYNPDTKFFHPKDSDGNFIDGVNYSTVCDKGARQYYGENNAWVFRWEEQHNIADLVSLMGGPEAFVSELDRTFSEPLGMGKLGFYQRMPDHTGIVGQFSMGNEPSCHVPYLYCYAGQPWRTQKRIRTLLDTWFRDDYIGLPGDEDGGGMSGFVVFSYLGFYPVTPGLPMYVIGSPVFEKASVALPGGKSFEVVCRNYAPENKYIQSAKLRGETLDRCWFTHDELMQGGKLEFVMGPEPNRQWASGSVPPSLEM